MENLFITGIKHSGKTTFARILSSVTGIPFFDSDDLISEIIKPLSIRDFYSRYGKDEFMKKEIQAVLSLIEKEKNPFILSLGGGASDNTQLMEVLKKNGRIIYLKRRKEDMLPVILKHGIPSFLEKDDLEGSFYSIYEKRNKIYEQYADKIIDLGPYRDKKETVMDFLDELKEYL